jgi:hypothetical protein
MTPLRGRLRLPGARSCDATLGFQLSAIGSGVVAELEFSSTLEARPAHPAQLPEILSTHLAEQNRPARDGYLSALALRSDGNRVVRRRFSTTNRSIADRCVHQTALANYMARSHRQRWHPSFRGFKSTGAAQLLVAFFSLSHLPAWRIALWKQAVPVRTARGNPREDVHG